MIVKEADDSAAKIDELNRLIDIAPNKKVKSRIEAELRMLRAGIKGESESGYHLDDHFRDSKNVCIIHDLRLEHNGRVAQVDHLLINRFLDVYVLETKQLHAGMKINDAGEFLQWNNFKKKFEGMASPLAQNARHIDVLKAVFEESMDMPTRMGFSLQPTFYSRVLVNATARIDRPKRFDTSEIVKSDSFIASYQKTFDEIGLVGAVTGMAKIISPEQVDFLSRKLARMHQPIAPNYAAKFGITKPAETPQPAEALKPQTLKGVAQEPAAYQAYVCGKCNSNNVKIKYGKYGYYFKCAACKENASIKLGCGVKGHQERLSKKGNQFFKVCPDCETRALFFENAEN